MTLAIDRDLLTNVCTFVGRAHNRYIRVVGSESEEDGPFYWLEAVKSYARGGNDLKTGIPTTSLLTVAAQGSPTFTVNITGGDVTISGTTVAVSTAATYGSAAIFSQTCTDGSALTAGQFYDAAVCTDHLNVKAVFRGPREDRIDTEVRPPVPSGFCVLATVRVRYSGTTTVIQTADITAGHALTAYAAQTDDPGARIFADFDAGQSKLISRTAVKHELGFALTSLDKYVKTITAALGLGTGGLGYGLLTWAKATHETVSPWDFPAGFAEYVRVLKNGKDHSMRLATVAFTGSGTATVVDKLVVLGNQETFDLVMTGVGTTGPVSSTVSVTTQTTGATLAVKYSATVPAGTTNGTVIRMTASGTAALQLPVPGTATLAAISASNVLAAQPAGTVTARVYTSLVASSPIAVTGGTSGDTFAIRNTGVL